MTNLKKTTALLLALLLVLMLAATGCAGAKKKTLKIGVAQITEHAALDAAREGFLQCLADNGYVDGENVTFDVQNAQGDQSTLSTIADRFVSEECDLILAIATPAAQAMAGKTTEIPILATAVTDFEVANLVESNAVPGGNVSGTSDMNPIEAQVALIFELFPEVQTVGCIYNGGEDNSVLQASLAKAEVEKAGRAYTEVTVTSTNDVQQAVSTLVTKCEAIYIPTDNTLASAMPVVSEVTNAAGIPVICGESGMVGGGGLATLGINYFDLGYQTGEMAVRILKDGAKIGEMPVEFATGFEPAFNADTAAALGFTVPAQYADSVS